MSEPMAGPARCFANVDDGFGHPGQCQAPVRWHGFVQSGRGGFYRVFACETHAETLGDRARVTRRLPAAGIMGDRLVIPL